MKIGLIGYGSWGKVHAASLKRLKDHTLVGIATRSDKSAWQATQENPDCFITTNVYALIGSPDVEVVDIVLPTHLHVPIALKALQQRKHVLLEKPMAGSLRECDELVTAATQSDRVVSIIHEFRCSVQWAWIQNTVAEGRIGRLRYALFNLFRFPYRKGAEGWRYQPNRVGSWVLEEPIHFIDLMLWYFASFPTAVTGWSTVSSEGMSQDFTAIFEYPQNTEFFKPYCVISQTLSGFQHHQVVEIVGELGAIRALWSGAMDRTDKPEYSVYAKLKGDEEAHLVPLEEPSGELFEIQKYLQESLDAMEQGTALYPVEQDRELVRFCLEAERSAREQKRISL